MPRASKPKFDEIHVLVHPFFNRWPKKSTREKQFSRLFDLYSKKIEAIARKENTLLVLGWANYGYPLDEAYEKPLYDLAIKKLGKTRVIQYTNPLDDKLKNIARSSPKVIVWGEYRLNRCIGYEAMRIAYALGVKPEKFADRVAINFAHSNYFGVSPNTTARVWKKPPEKRCRAFARELRIRDAERKVLSYEFANYYTHREAGHPHEYAFFNRQKPNYPLESKTQVNQKPEAAYARLGAAKKSFEGKTK